MDNYYVDKNPQFSGEHEVHVGSCKHLPKKENLIDLGRFSNCSKAMKEAKKQFEKVDGCYYCCLLFHKR